MTDNVPVVTSLEDIYTSDTLPAERKRWANLLSTFESTYGHAADFVARSPGRVNIIGEHIDYSLYSVLPMAIAADCIIAVSLPSGPSSPSSTTFKLSLSNVQPSKFPRRDFEIPNESVEIDSKVHEWTNYFKCGLKGALEFLRLKHGPSFKPTDLNILIDGTVPSGGGLSSSAAFVSASALAVLIANNEPQVDKTQLTELAIVSERNVGVNSGGMDQSASVFSQRGSALLVDFTPSLSARPVQFPAMEPEGVWMIAQTFVQADKHTTGPVCYNLRVVECTLAAAYLHAFLSKEQKKDLLPLAADASPLGVSLRGFQNSYFGITSPLTMADQLRSLASLVSSTLTQEEGYTRSEIAAVLGISIDELQHRYESSFPVRAERFKIRQRALHVYTEALRVLEFIELLESKTSEEEIGRKLGALMNATQTSCRELYDCSCPELDEMCRIALNAGAYGSRLTGAGWGGCSVHLVPSDKVESVRSAWDAEYYEKMEGGRGISEEMRKKAVVVSRPGSGSAVVRVKGLGLGLWDGGASAI